jgi:hypothetical protein
MARQKTLIVLQENTGRTPFDDSLPGPLRRLVNAMIDGLAETFEDVKMRLQAGGRYHTVHQLTDAACTRARLLQALVDETNKKRIIDLIVLGHGEPERLLLYEPPHLEGDAGTRSIRELLTDARNLGVESLNLRMVFMCNCHGATVNDDWLEVGAKVSVGPRALDMMPEPMTTFFLHNWMAGQRARLAAKNAYEATVPFYLPFYPPSPRIQYKTVEVPYPCPTLSDPLRICKKSLEVPAGVDLVSHTYVQQSELVVAGDANARF